MLPWAKENFTESQIYVYIIAFVRGGPNTSLSWVLFVTLAFMFLMIVVGWLTNRKEQDQSEVRHKSKMPAKKDGRKLN